MEYGTFKLQLEFVHNLSLQYRCSPFAGPNLICFVNPFVVLKTSTGCLLRDKRQLHMLFWYCTVYQSRRSSANILRLQPRSLYSFALISFLIIKCYVAPTSNCANANNWQNTSFFICQPYTTAHSRSRLWITISTVSRSTPTAHE